MYLSVYRPATVYSAQVNQPGIARGARTVTYSLISGSLGDVLPLFTVWIGSTPGAKDLGKIRLRSISGSQIVVAENSIAWQHGSYITILRDVGIWSVWPRLVDDVFYKDFDIPHSDQNSNLDPIIVCGPDRAGFLDNGSLVFAVNLSKSYCPGSSISSFSAAAYPSDGVSISLNTSTGIGTITLTTAGSRLIEFSATAANGKNYKTYRIYIAHPRSGANAPIIQFKLTSPISGQVDQPGYSTRIEVSGPASLTDFPDNATIIIWKEDEYADSSQPVALDEYGSILFNGFIRSDQFSHGDPKGNHITTFQATTIGHLLSRHRMFSISINAVANPTKWYEFKSTLMTPGIAIYHLIKEHSTAMRRSDWIGLASDAIYLKAVDFLEANLFSQAAGLAQNLSVLAQFSGDNQGRMYFQRNPQFLDDSEKSALAEVMEIEREDIDGSLTIVRQPELSNSMSHLSGFYYNPISAASTPLISKAPGDAPEWSGENIVNVERQALINQIKSNQLVGRIHSYHNAEYKEFRLNMVGDYSGGFATMPRRWYRMSINGSYNNRQITFSNARFLCQEVSLSYDSQIGDIVISITLEREIIAQDGVTGDYPTEIPESTDPSGYEVSWPTEINPSEGYEGLPPTEIPPEDGSMPALVAWGSCMLLEDLTAGWQDASGGLAGNDVHGCTRPAWQQSAETANPENAKMYRLNSNKVLMTTNGGQNWREIGPRLGPTNDMSDSPAPVLADLTAVKIHCSRIGILYVLYRWKNATTGWRGWIARTMDSGESDWEWLTVNKGTGLTAENVPPWDFEDGVQGWSCRADINMIWAATRVNPAVVLVGAPPTQQIWVGGSGYTGTVLASPDMDVYRITLTESSRFQAKEYSSARSAHYRIVFTDGTHYIFYGAGTDLGGPRMWDFSLSAYAGKIVKRVEFHVASVNSWWTQWDYIWFNSVVTGDVLMDTYPLWFDVDENDLSMVVTAQRNENLMALIYALDNTPEEVPESPEIGTETARILPASAPTEVVLGGCTLEELEDNTWQAYPAFWPHLQDFVVYGLLNAPPGIAGNCQIVEVAGGVLSPEPIVGGDTNWFSDVCGSLKFYNPLGSDRSYIYALRNAASGAALGYTFTSDGQGWLAGAYVEVNGLDDPGMVAATYDGTNKCLSHQVAASTGQILIGKKIGYTYSTFANDQFSFRYKLTIVSGSVSVSLQDTLTNTVIGPISSNVDWTTASYALTAGTDLEGLSFIIQDTVGTGTFILYLDDIKISGSSGCTLYVDAGTPKRLLGFKPVPVTGGVGPDGMAINQKGRVAIGSVSSAMVVVGWIDNWTDASAGLSSSGIKSLRWL